MKKSIIAFSTFLCIIQVAFAQGPGLIISEFLANPAGTDSPFEYVELVATKSIDFSVTPYSVVFTNNGTATTAGWVAGGGLTYGFDITSGTVVQGNVVYVGGSTMTPTGTKLRVINTGTTNGDGFGNFSTGGVLGNGGGNADGIAVFAQPTASLTSNTVPIDAIFFGTGVGTAVVSGGTAGYQMPNNDLYPGGKLQSTAFLAPDAGSTQVIVATGTFNNVTGSFTTARNYAIAPGTDLVTAITFSTAVGNVNFAMQTTPTNQTINETTPSATFTVTVTAPNSAQAIVQVVPSFYSTATLGVDYTISNSIIVAPAGSTTTQTVTINMLDDALIEQKSELALFSLVPLTNATVTGANLHAVYITDDDNVAPVESNELVFQLLGSYSNGAEGSNSAEIVAHDPSTQRLYIANSVGAKLDIVDFSNPASPTLFASIPVMPTYGNINSVAVYNGLVACAIENSSNPQDSGKIVFFDASGVFIKSVKVGAMPDMLTFNHAGNKVVVACEGEPNAAYTNDPQGRVCVVDVTAGAATLTQANVSFINFTAYDGTEAALRATGIRIYGPGATASMDFEPEYVTISDDDQTAWVTLQENNAVAKIDLNTNTILQLMPLGYKDLSIPGNGFDGSDQTAGINIVNLPIKSMTLPDAISHFTSAGTTYFVTANEGDSRAYAGYNEESRISGGAIVLDPTVFPNGTQLKSNIVAGRLNVTTSKGDIDSDGDFDELYSLGGRSFSIFNATTGALVFDSGDDFERIISTHPTYSTLFNASNTSGAAVAKNRSDDKGPECEGITVATIDGEIFAFASLERVGGVMIYNITNPINPIYVGYHNNRSFVTNGPDRGAEGMIYIDPSDSPNGNAIMLLANEISSTLTVYQINTCAEQAGINLTSDNGLSICAGSTTDVSTSPLTGVTYQWFENGSIMAGETDTVVTVNTTGNYALAFASSTFACYDSTSVDVVVNSLPTVTANANLTTICSNDTLVLYGTGANTYSWDNGATDSIPFFPSSSLTYNVTGIDTNGCSGTSAISITVNTAPTISTIVSDPDFCVGGTTTLTASGAATITWSGGITNGLAFNPSISGTYIATGVDGAGCVNYDTVSITVYSLPTVGATASDVAVCAGDATTVTGTGASTYSWTGGVTDGVSFVPTGSLAYTVTGTDVNGCTDTGLIFITVNPLPIPVITNSMGVLSTTTFASVQWYLNSVLIPGATSSTYTPTVDGDYTVEVTDANGCMGTSTIYTLNTSGLNALNEASFSVYPNPFTNTLTVNNPTGKPVEISLVNAYGQQVYMNKNFIGGEIDLSAFAKGIYQLKIQNFASQFTKLVVKN